MVDKSKNNSNNNEDNNDDDDNSNNINNNNDNNNNNNSDISNVHSCDRCKLKFNDWRKMLSHVSFAW